MKRLSCFFAYLLGHFEERERLLLALSAGLVVALWITLLIKVNTFAVDIPYLDEWETFTSNQLTKEFSLSWIFTRHGDHLIAPTRLLTWIVYQLTDLDFRVSQIVNVFLFGALLISLYNFARSAAPTMPRWLTLLLLSLVLSPNCWENHLWSFQSQFHFFLLFFISAMTQLFLGATNGSKMQLSLGCLALFLTTISFSAGAAAALAGSAVYLCWQLSLFLARSKDSSKTTGLSQILWFCLPVLLSFGLSFSLWYMDFNKLHHGSSDLVSPFSLQFWNFVARLVSFGFGFDTLSLPLAYASLLIVVLPLLLVPLLLRQKIQPPLGVWLSSAVTSGALAALGAVAFGRAAYPNFERVSRYSEIAMMLVIPTAILWSYAYSLTRDTYSGALGNIASYSPALFVLLFAAVGSADDWNFNSAFTPHFEQMERGRECLYRGLKRGSDVRCEDLYPATIPLDLHLQRMQELQLSFIKKHQKKRRHSL